MFKVISSHLACTYLLSPLINSFANHVLRGKIIACQKCHGFGGVNPHPCTDEHRIWHGKGRGTLRHANFLQMSCPYGETNRKNHTLSERNIPAGCALHNSCQYNKEIRIYTSFFKVCWCREPKICKLSLNLPKLHLWKLVHFVEHTVQTTYVKLQFTYDNDRFLFVCFSRDHPRLGWVPKVLQRLLKL